ncbi:hypothetical protein G9464_13300 [Halostella sp. JP-L12]|uniref:DUF308 domain-containing protein n=1 Tax=Halostella TaxID=1843185 RepID=UPI000EF78A9C|nr:MULTISPECIES: DUF308 domain-containing protein [Halostella]NHN48562.1 hypothetical protein [Halostella sp. JP-L12]
MEDGGNERAGADRAGPNEAYCTSCGAVVNAKAVICPECGVEQGPNAGSDGDSEFQQRLVDEQLRGWEVQDRYRDSVVLVKRSPGSLGMHALVFFLTIWWTGGLGNALYAAYKYFVDVDRKVIRRDADSASDLSVADEIHCRSCGEQINARADICPHCGVRTVTTGETDRSRVDETLSPADIEDSSDTDVVSWILGVLLTIGGIGAATSAGIGSILTGIFMLALGLYLIPPIRERVRSTYPPSAFGRHQRVEETVLRGGERPCSICFDPVEEGVEREYHDEFVLFGVPVYTYESGTNEYCRDCVSGRAVDAGVGDLSDATTASDGERAVEFETE